MVEVPSEILPGGPSGAAFEEVIKAGELFEVDFGGDFFRGAADSEVLLGFFRPHVSEEFAGGQAEELAGVTPKLAR